MTSNCTFSSSACARFMCEKQNATIVITPLGDSCNASYPTITSLLGSDVSTPCVNQTIGCDLTPSQRNSSGRRSTSNAGWLAALVLLLGAQGALGAKLGTVEVSQPPVAPAANVTAAIEALEAQYPHAPPQTQIHSISLGGNFTLDEVNHFLQHIGESAIEHPKLEDRDCPPLYNQYSATVTAT
ncbi:hypothetical protein I302_101484 [Kwoniella bestiolae CBS 10118]|uniref:Uncharacterized protein n=1 Tax=Kwoniella bestiolae CBS 10118 TaxID=1296100 RepID=A0A1B9GCE6_9TREE|nr:hypothetical protein I302_00167 [Kwoniella bestiolae CBS 10118]OCF28678.1 hypothetical protein I302_00167 [Kwoniella bestiolae CBS 10118]